MNLEELKRKMDKEHYIYDDTLSTVLYVALQLGRPLLIEGAAGVGKTEVAKVMAAALDRELVRLQCYEGLDESKALYEWNYQKQLLSIQVNMNAQDREALTRSLFSDEYLLERPLLKSIRSEKPVVLLIDEIDKADLEFPNDLLWELKKRRSNEAILKKPSIAETLDWAAALDALGIRELTPDALRKTAGFVLKNNEDMAALEEEEMSGCRCGGCEGHHHD